MKTQHGPHDLTDTAADQRFDAAMRGRHRAAVGNISPQVRWKLQPMAPRARAGTRSGWRLGTAFASVAAAVFAVAIGFNLRGDGPATLSTQASVAALAANGNDDNATVYDQDPDFYAWLASDDANLVAVE